jgi:membrane-associated protein
MLCAQRTVALGARLPGAAAARAITVIAMRPALAAQPPRRTVRAAPACSSAALPAPSAHPPAPSLAARLASWPAARPLAAAALAALLLAALPPAAMAKAKVVAAAAAPAASQGLLALAGAALSFVLHLDVHLAEIAARYGAATYAILFAIVFAETGLVVTPFLPGDSLLFATGALAALGSLSLPALLAVYVVAATLGDAVNYAGGCAALQVGVLRAPRMAGCVCRGDGARKELGGAVCECAAG